MKLSSDERIRDPNPNISDGGHVILECSNCGCPLVDFFITGPQNKVETIAKCNCPYCGDSSFEKIIKGTFHLGCTAFTAIDSIDSTENRIQVTAVKGEKIYE